MADAYIEAAKDANAVLASLGDAADADTDADTASMDAAIALLNDLDFISNSVCICNDGSCNYCIERCSSTSPPLHIQCGDVDTEQYQTPAVPQMPISHPPIPHNHIVHAPQIHTPQARLPISQTRPSRTRVMRACSNVKYDCITFRSQGVIAHTMYVVSGKNPYHIAYHDWRAGVEILSIFDN